mmetsp:Transcript_19251/g.41846  ORF Transcript_19251/g.41846 Transcript_19251/m.41846 type:complete len:299 (+) Transcript_19251:948-1844(+)
MNVVGFDLNKRRIFPHSLNSRLCPLGCIEQYRFPGLVRFLVVRTRLSPPSHRGRGVVWNPAPNAHQAGCNVRGHHAGFQNKGTATGHRVDHSEPVLISVFVGGVSGCNRRFDFLFPTCFQKQPGSHRLLHGCLVNGASRAVSSFVETPGWVQAPVNGEGRRTLVVLGVSHAPQYRYQGNIGIVHVDVRSIPAEIANNIAKGVFDAESGVVGVRKIFWELPRVVHDSFHRHSHESSLAISQQVLGVDAFADKVVEILSGIQEGISVDVVLVAVVVVVVVRRCHQLQKSVGGPQPAKGVE